MEIPAPPTYRHDDGRSVTITIPMDESQAIGEIYFGTLSNGSMSSTMSVTKVGLAAAGFVLDEVDQPELPFELSFDDSV